MKTEKGELVRYLAVLALVSDGVRDIAIVTGPAGGVWVLRRRHSAAFSMGGGLFGLFSGGCFGCLCVPVGLYVTPIVSNFTHGSTVMDLVFRMDLLRS